LLDNNAVVVHGIALVVLVPVLFEPARDEELWPRSGLLRDDARLAPPGRDPVEIGLPVGVEHVVRYEERADRFVVLQFFERRILDAGSLIRRPLM